MSDIVQGGPATPGASVTGVVVRAGPAIPIAYVDNVPVAGGPALPLYVVSDAEVASGAYVVAAGPALPVALVSDRVVTAAPAIPVYVVGGGPTPPPSLESTILSYAPYAYWPLDDASGTTARDASGNGHDGAYAGAYTLAVAEAPFDAALGLAGAGWVNVFSAGLAGAFASARDAGTMLLFVRPTSNAGQLDAMNLVTASPNARSLTTVFYGGDDKYLETDRIIPGGTSTFLYDIIPAINVWYLHVATWDVSAGEGRLYINGALAYSDASGSTWGATALTEAYIGSLINGSGSGTNWVGQIAHVALFDTVLDAAAVAAIYAAAGL